MAVAVKRFKILDSDFDVPAPKDFQKLGSSVYNTPVNDNPEISDAMKGAVVSSGQSSVAPTSLKDALSKAKAELSKVGGKFAAAKGELSATLSKELAGASGKLSQVKGEFATAAASASKAIDGAVSNFSSAASQALSQKGSLTKDLGTALSDVTRSTKGLFGGVVSMKNLAEGKVKDFMKEILPSVNMGGISDLTKLAQKCSKPMGVGLPGRPYDGSINCRNGQVSGKKTTGYGGASSGCDASTFSNLLNMLTGGEYNGIFSDVSKALTAIMALSGYGYNLGMCGVFGSLSKQFGGDNKGMLGRASGALTGLLSSRGDSLGAADVMRSSIGLPAVLENPGMIGDYFKNFKKPSSIGERDFPFLAELAVESPSFVDSGHFTSDYDRVLSAGSTNGSSDSFQEVASTRLNKDVFDAESLDAINSSDESFLDAAMFA